MAGKGEKGRGVLFIFLLAGIIAGTVIGEALAETLPFLARGYDIGLTKPVVFDAGVLEFTAGIKFRLSLSGIAGLLLAYFLYRKI